MRRGAFRERWFRVALPGWCLGRSGFLLCWRAILRGSHCLSSLLKREGWLGEVGGWFWGGQSQVRQTQILLVVPY